MSATATDQKLVQPRFMKERKVNISFDTTGFCQARCATCVWIDFPKSGRVMMLEEFKHILAQFQDFELTELNFNSINEPFTDRTILDKIEHYLDVGPNTRTLFFSSNWLNVSEAQVDRFVDLMEYALRSGRAKNLNLNATVSGIDENTYDVLQAGRELTKSEHRYRRLDFQTARRATLRLAKQLERLKGLPFVFYIKGYGDAISDSDYKSYWTSAVADAGVSPEFAAPYIRPVMNHAFTSFARSTARAGARRVCSGGYIIDKIVVGHDGQLGLCGRESARIETFGSLLNGTIDDVVQSPKFQQFYAVVTGEADADAGLICTRCEHFQPSDSAA